MDLSPLSLMPGEKQIRQLVASKGHERFLMDFWRGTLRLTKANLQTRARTAVILARLDIDGAPHTNPDGEVIAGTHLHVYREGFEDRWATPLEPTRFSDPSSLGQCFEDFCRYCRISSRPSFQSSLV